MKHEHDTHEVSENQFATAAREISMHVEAIKHLAQESWSELRQATKADLLEMEKRIMSAITDFAAKMTANFATLKTEITGLNAKITAFNNSPGTLSAADQAALDGIQAQSDALVAAANSTSAPVVPPTPAG